MSIGEASIETIQSRGVLIPRLGLGTFRMPLDICRPVVESALALGFRHIDTASMYENEEAVGAAIKSSRIPRNELFITTKVWRDQLTPDGIRRAHADSLERLGLAYTGLYMIHWPDPAMNMRAALDALTSLRSDGLTRAVGVCNFNLPMLRYAIEDLNYLEPLEIRLTAYAPLAQGRLAADPVLASIGQKHGVEAAQIALAWILRRRGTIAIPKAQSEESQWHNLLTLQIALDDEDARAIDRLPKDQRYVKPAFAPDWSAATYREPEMN